MYDVDLEQAELEAKALERLTLLRRLEAVTQHPDNHEEIRISIGGVGIELQRGLGSLEKLINFVCGKCNSEVDLLLKRHADLHMAEVRKHLELQVRKVDENVS